MQTADLRDVSGVFRGIMSTIWWDHEAEVSKVRRDFPPYQNVFYILSLSLSFKVKSLIFFFLGGGPTNLRRFSFLNVFTAETSSFISRTNEPRAWSLVRVERRRKSYSECTNPFPCEFLWQVSVYLTLFFSHFLILRLSSSCRLGIWRFRFSLHWFWEVLSYVFICKAKGCEFKSYNNTRIFFFSRAHYDVPFNLFVG